MIFGYIVLLALFIAFPLIGIVYAVCLGLYFLTYLFDAVNKRNEAKKD